MRGNKASVLAITLGFVLAFTMLGFQAIYLTGLNRELTQKQTSATKAFWLAEAGIERAASQLPEAYKTNPTLIQQWHSLGEEGQYQIYSLKLKAGYNHRWEIESWGDVTPVRRKIQAEVGAYAIDAFQTTGTIKKNSEDHILPTGSYSAGRENFYFTFAGLLGSLSQNSSGVQIVDDGGAPGPGFDKNGIPLHDGVIWVNGDLKVTTDNTKWEGYEGVLVVNGDFVMTGGTFKGIVWVNGAADMIEGNPGVEGAIFVNDPKDGQTTIGGASGVVYNALEIDQAYDILIAIDPTIVRPETFHNILTWKEID